MPTYSYTTADGKRTIERFYSLGLQPQKVRHQGRTFHRNPVADHKLVAATPSIEGEITSLSMGVHRSDAAKAQADANRRRLKGVRFEKDGKVTFASRNAKKQFMLAYGFCNWDPGYGDVTQDQAREARSRRGEPEPTAGDW